MLVSLMCLHLIEFTLQHCGFVELGYLCLQSINFPLIWDEYISLSFLYFRRADRGPNRSSRICSCNFPDGKAKGPIFNRSGKVPPIAPSLTRTTAVVTSPDSALAAALKEVEHLKCQLESRCIAFSVSSLSSEEIGQETSLPDKATFQVLYTYVATVKGSIKYHHGWRVEDIGLENQILMCLMKLRYNYPSGQIVLLQSHHSQQCGTNICPCPT